MSVIVLTEHHLEYLSLKRGCTGSSESTLVKMPHCWKSHVTVQCINKIEPSPQIILMIEEEKKKKKKKKKKKMFIYLVIGQIKKMPEFYT